MHPGPRAKWILFVAALFGTLLVVEVTLRFFVEPAEMAWGTLFGVELPPFRVVPRQAADESHRAEWAAKPAGIQVDGVELTAGDLHGILREHPRIGHVPDEHTVSARGWWQANNLGARASRDIDAAKPVGVLRVLIFGDSYAHGARVRAEETWCHALNAIDARVDAWSFGVDGYGMGQSWLRFQEIAPRVEYDLALLVWVPDKSLEREINVSRYIGFGWEAYKIDPRFVFDGESLRLVPSPYRGLGDLVEQNRDGMTRGLRDHLRQYEGFYLRTQYEPIPLVGHSVLLKRWLASRFPPWKEAVAQAVMEPGSEAQRLSRMIFAAMAQQVARDGREFVLVVLPSRLATRDYRNDLAYRTRWRKLSADACGGGYACVDLMDGLSRYELKDLDRGYDSSHFGPRTNRLVADSIWERVVRPRIEARFPAGREP